MAGAKSVLSDLINCCSWKPAQLLPQAGNITSKNSSFPEPLLLRLAALPRSEAQLQRPQDNGCGYGLSPVKTGEADKELTRGVERLFGHCLISVAGICSVASTAGIKRQEEGNQWNYFLRPPRLTVPPLWQGGPSCSCFLWTQDDATAACGSSAEVCGGRDWHPAWWGTNPSHLSAAYALGGHKD